MADMQPLSMIVSGKIEDLGAIKPTPPPIEWERDLGLQTVKPEAPQLSTPRKNPGMSTYWQPTAGMR